MRCFIGLDLPLEIKDRLASLQSGLPETKWVDPQSFQLTLAFLGDLNSYQHQEVVTALSTIDVPAFQLRLQGLDRFGSGSKTRVLWAGVEPNPILERLAAAVREKLSSCACQFDSRKFRPHITLSRHCRLKDQQLAEFLGYNAGFSSAFFDVQDYHLFSSHRTDRGADYQKESTFPLSLTLAG